MATGRIILPALAWFPLDGSTDNAAAVLDFVQSTGGPPGPRYPRWGFAQTTAPDDPENICVVFRLPDDYASLPKLKIDWYTAGTDTFAFYSYMAALSAGDAVASAALDSAVQSSPTTNNGAGELNQAECDFQLYDDDLAAGDLVALVLTRPNAGLAEDVYFLGGIFEYTTT